MENKIIRTPMLPSKSIIITNDSNENEQYRFMAYTDNDIANFEKILNNINEIEFFNNITKCLNEELLILKVENLEFEYRNLSCIGLGWCFIITDETSTWNIEYNS